MIGDDHVLFPFDCEKLVSNKGRRAEEGDAMPQDIEPPGNEKDQDSDLDDLLEDIASGIDTTSQDVVILNNERKNRCAIRKQAHLPL